MWYGIRCLDMLIEFVIYIRKWRLSKIINHLNVWTSFMSGPLLQITPCNMKKLVPLVIHISNCATIHENIPQKNISFDSKIPFCKYSPLKVKKHKKPSSTHFATHKVVQITKITIY